MKIEDVTIEGDYKAATGAAGSSELLGLSAEIIDFFYMQAFSPEDFESEQDVCRAFASILLRHWELSGIITFLPSDKGQPKVCAVHSDGKFPETKINETYARLAAAAEQRGSEVLILPESDEYISGSTWKLHTLLKDTDVRFAAVAVPVYAHKTLFGVLIAVASDSNHLREALAGIRLVAAPIVIAVSNMRRATALSEQRRHIEHLVQDLQERSAALEEANRELQRIARYRSLFLARMSHELRTPLTSILGFAEILLDQEELTAPQQSFCERIQASGLQLQTSLDGLVDLSRLEAGHSEIFLQEFSLREIARESCAAVARLAKKQSVILERRFAADLTPVVSDGGKLRQILYNFLAFAIARSPENGSVTISVQQPEATFFEIEICDEGEALADPAHLFEPTGEDAPNERGTNMNELGLVIAARLAKILGATISLNEPTNGTTCSSGTIDMGIKHGLCIRLRFPSLPS